MKKLFAILMAIAMIAALSVTAFAATATIEDVVAPNNSADITVTGDWTAEVKDDVYYVTLSQDALTFAYSEAVYEWNTSTMKWDTTTEAGWAATSAEIEIGSKSSAAVTATFTADTDSTTATLLLKEKESAEAPAAEVVVNLNSAENADPAQNGTEQKATIVVSVTGDLEADETIGTITVALS